MRDDSDVLPDHLADGPTFDEAGFLFSAMDASDAAEIHVAVATLAHALGVDTAPHSTRYFVLGNYDEPQKERLERTKRLIEGRGFENVAFLLEDVDPGDDRWENFYLKFRYVLSMIDYVLVVVEDNDGGHELELGEVSLANTFVLKRDYASASIDSDLEREKYDAMLETLCELLAKKGQLFGWHSMESFDAAVEAVAAETGQ